RKYVGTNSTFFPTNSNHSITRSLPINGCVWCLENTLVECNIEPASKFKTGLADGAGMAESQFLMKRDAGAIAAIDAADHHVILLLFGLGNELLHQQQSQPFAAIIFVNVNRMFHRIFISGPGAK